MMTAVRANTFVEGSTTQNKKDLKSLKINECTRGGLAAIRLLLITIIASFAFDCCCHLLPEESTKVVCVLF